VHDHLPDHRAVNGRRAGLAALALVALGGCGDASIETVDAAIDGGVCGTRGAPGILTLTSLTPAAGATVHNQAIVHGFTVVRAPAEFNNFTLKLGPSHTAGLPSPENPMFRMTTVGSDIIYQLVVDTWSISPGHVELAAGANYELKGCTWSFPEPLFSYDIVGQPDGGAALDGARADARAVDLGGVDARAADVGMVDAGAVDAGAAVDLGADVPLQMDVPANQDAGVDASELDTGATG
jgi:hypothetical protein